MCSSVLEQKSEVSDIISIFNPIINFFKSEISSNLKINSYNDTASRYTINLINKTEKYFTVKLLSKIANINNAVQNNILLLNGFDYGFFIVPRKEEMIINNGEYSFLHIIEFEVG